MARITPTAPMTTTTTAAAVLITAAGLASAGDITQSISYQLGENDFIQPMQFAQFDTMGGTRVLTGVTVGLVADLGMTVTIQNFSPTTLAAGEWEAEAFHNVLFSFLSEGEDENSVGAPFYGLGGIGTGPITGDLGPGSGGIFGEGGTPVTVSLSDSINSTVDTSAGFFSFFTGTGMLDAIAGPFTDAVITPPADGSNVTVSSFLTTQDATLSLTYSFDVVPAPSGVAAFGLLGLAATRRRR